MRNNQQRPPKTPKTPHQGRMGRGVRGIHGHPSFEILHAQSEKINSSWEKIGGKLLEERERKEIVATKKRIRKRRYIFGVFMISTCK
jgi:hypothetical protein